MNHKSRDLKQMQNIQLFSMDGNAQRSSNPHFPAQQNLPNKQYYELQQPVQQPNHSDRNIVNKTNRNLNMQLQNNVRTINNPTGYNSYSGGTFRDDKQ